ncbi:MAG: hypothetical protein SF339_26720 [Blastocatellia bacterium]|nr:hypothetical protein [Blastocatellia bacterium]
MIDKTNAMQKPRRSAPLILLTVAAVLSLALTTPAQSPDRVLKQAIKAMTNGKGEKALRGIRSWQSKGVITDAQDAAAGSFAATAMAPNLYTDRYDLRGVEFSVGYNGKSGWRRNSREGLQTLTGQASRDFTTEAQYRNLRWLDAKRDKSKLTLAGQTTIEGKPANTVLLTSAKNVKIRMHFDAASGLLVREEMPAGEAVRIFDYSDYRLVGQVMEPHSIRMTIGEQRLEIKLSEIRHNPQLDRAIFDFPRVSNEPLPDIAALMQEVKQNEEKVDEILEKYTFTQTQTTREIDSNGQIRDKESETFEMTFYKGNRIRRLIEKNGKPLTPDQEADETKRIEKRVRDIEKREAEKAKKAQKQAEREVAQENSGPPDDDRGQRISIADVLRASNLINPRRERFRDRDVIVFDFEPLPGYKPQKSYEKFFGKTAGAIWVDANDKQVARVEARLIDSYKVGGGLLASLKEGATFVLEQDHINNEIWLPSRADINLGVRVLLVKGINVNSVVTYGNYKRFNVESEKEKLKDPVSTEKPAKP